MICHEKVVDDLSYTKYLALEDGDGVEVSVVLDGSFTRSELYDIVAALRTWDYKNDPDATHRQW